MNLLNHAWQELRQHPSRFAATLVAIIVSVAFLTATQVFGATESNAAKLRTALQTTHADLVAETYLWHSEQSRWRRDDALTTTERLLSESPDVTHYERFSRMLGRVANGQTTSSVMLTTIPKEPSLRWFEADEGRLPQNTKEAMLTDDVAKHLGVGIGDTVRIAVNGLDEVTVVGLTHQRGYADPPLYLVFDALLEADANFPTPDYNLIITPDSSTRRATPGSSGDGVGVSILIQLKDPNSADRVAAEVQERLKREAILRFILTVKTADTVRAESAAQLSTSQNLMGWLLTGAGGLALLVGALIIATTFAILMVQQRRQVGLMRAVGASRSQVLRRSAFEALLLGLIGTAIGMPLGIGAGALASYLATGGVEFGLQVPTLTLALIAVIGVVLTVLASFVAIRQASKVSPLEALRPTVPAEISRRHQQVAGGALLALLVLGLSGLRGVLFATPGLGGDRPIVWAAISAGLVVVAVLGSSWIWVPWVVRVVTLPLRGARPELRLARDNTVRNPVRVGATSTALMLAVGLIVTVQVGAASGLAAAYQMADKRFPVDIAMQPTVVRDLSDPGNGQGEGMPLDANGNLIGFGAQAMSLTTSAPGVASAQMLRTTNPLLVRTSQEIYDSLLFTTLPASMSSILSTPVHLEPNEVGMSAEDMVGLNLRDGDPLTLLGSYSDDAATGQNSPHRTKIVREVNLSLGVLVVSPEAIEYLGGVVRDGLIVAKLTSPDQAGTAIESLTGRLLESHKGLQIGGGAELKANLASVLEGLSLVLTGLLGVTAVVALIGVSNTLGLSVLERTRESALLRALGLQRRGLQWMLVVEALLLSLVAVAVGVGAGVFFGWAGARSVAKDLAWPPARLVIDWVPALLCALAVLVAAAVASIVPGRRAARAAPVDALADVG